MENNKPIYITQHVRPPIEEFTELLKQIWDNKILTNNGLFHQQLEKELTEFLGLMYISPFANVTLALLTDINVLRLKGEAIITLCSFVVATNALWWKTNRFFWMSENQGRKAFLG